MPSKVLPEPGPPATSVGLPAGSPPYVMSSSPGIPVGAFPSGVAITPGGDRVYVTNQGSGNLSVISTATNTVTATFSTEGLCPLGIAIMPVTVPTTVEQCKNGGWKDFGAPAGPFRNQGDCVSYVRSRRAGKH